MTDEIALRIEREKTKRTMIRGLIAVTIVLIFFGTVLLSVGMRA